MADAVAAAKVPDKPLESGQLFTAAIMLALINFVVVLDTTIANVSVPHIAGGLAISPSQGTYVITSYAVAEAITVPLTGWLARTFGTVRVFITAILMFGVFSALCGMSNSLAMLVIARILQGVCGGPLMPLSQTLLMRIFPKEKLSTAMALWSMTTLVAPILGPIVGGYICDNYSWPPIFLINVPICVMCAFFGWRMLKKHETPTAKAPIDVVGLIFLIIWVGALQFTMDKGNEMGWFDSKLILAMAITSAIGFAAFLIWELTDEHPIVEIRTFLNPGFTFSVVTLCLTFGAFFGSAVLTPLWLQTYMGYTAVDAGITMGMTGILAVLVAPFAARLSSKVDPRKLVTFGVGWLCMVMFYRSFNNTDMSFNQIAAPLLAMGIGMPFFFIPLTGMALSSVTPEQTATAAGLMSFARTLSGAFATALITSVWQDNATYHRNDLAGIVDSTGQAAQQLAANGFTPEQTTAQIDFLVQNQSIMLATNHIFQLCAVALFLSASAVWLVPKPRRKADISAAH